MMQAAVVGIEQHLDFDTKKIRNYVVMDLGGTRVTAELHDLDQVAALIGEGMRDATPPPEEELRRELIKQVAMQTAEDVVQGEPLFVEQEQPAEESPSLEGEWVNWRELPNSTLSSQHKDALDFLGVAETMPLQDLQALVSNISEQFTEEDWAQLSNKAQPVEESAVEEPPPKKASPQLTWTDGTPIVGGGALAKTVPKDEMGYPVVPKTHTPTVASDDVVHESDVDEDGVPQA